MATILNQGPTGDGYDVRFVTAGQAYVLHFAAQPSADALQDALLRFEQRLMDDIAAAMDTDREEGDVLLYAE